ncbi:elongation factor Ts [Candidatus Uzinura diaspidicola str. ASNER]|uniref:Elongation factor Ts n=1 Tax=Candidatus Uzinura diaspidicola str. ASNER TaxID=1133592 RepID=L7VK89_9FLAO|nr:elongation factor Ts [Candidatus Uzinura diaspidicola str. ASNER]
MYKVHVDDIIKLREKTGFGIFDCKKALLEMKGNIEKAIEYLRKNSINKTYNSSDHNTNSTQGIVLSKVNSNNKKGIIIGINCETDFVAKNDLFIKLANEIAEIAIDCNDKNEILSSSIRNISIKEILFEHMTIIGEKLTLNFFEKLESYFVEKYVHHGNKIAALVGLSAAPKGVHIIGKELAMQVVAMNPIALKEEDIPYNFIEKEKEILKEQERRFGKSEDLLEKIIQGKIKKFLCEKTLICQKYIKNQKITVQNYLKQFNSNITITGYKRISL